MGVTSSSCFTVGPSATYKEGDVVELLIWSDTERSHRYELSSITVSSDSPCTVVFERRRVSPEEVFGIGTIRLNGYVPNVTIPMYETQVNSGWDIWVKVTYKNDKKLGPVDISIQGRI